MPEVVGATSSEGFLVANIIAIFIRVGIITFTAL